jgi:hypothetical protein
MNKRLITDKQSSLFCFFVINEEESFHCIKIRLQCHSDFLTFYPHRWGKMNKRLVTDKQSSLFCFFVLLTNGLAYLSLTWLRKTTLALLYQWRIDSGSLTIKIRCRKSLWCIWIKSENTSYDKLTIVVNIRNLTWPHRALFFTKIQSPLLKLMMIRSLLANLWLVVQVPYTPPPHPRHGCRVL